MTLEITRLANGLTVASDFMMEAQSVSLGMWVGAGARHEAPAENGLAHLLEHMMFKGTATRSARKIAEEIEAVGGQINAYTGREVTAYHARLLPDDLPLGVELIADILQNSLFEAQELERERQVVLQEIGQAEDTPDDIIFDRFQEAAFPGQGIGRPVLGRPDVVGRLSRDQLFAFQARCYGAERMVLAAAGAVEHKRLVDLAERYFAEFRSASLLSAGSPRYRGGAYCEERDLEQVHLLLGSESLSYHDPDYHACAVFSVAFGGGMSSRLFQELREQLGLVYSVFSFMSTLSDGGLFGVYAGTSEEEVERLLPRIHEEWHRIAAEGLSAGELARTKAQLRASIAMGRESSENRVEHLANQLLIHGRAIAPEEILARIAAVDNAAIMRVAARLLESELTLALLGPVQSLVVAEGLRDGWQGASALPAA